MDSVVHFEMAYEDRVRMTTFYETAFGWQTQNLGPGMWNYVIAITTEAGEDGMPKNPAPSTAVFTKSRPIRPRIIRRW